MAGYADLSQVIIGDYFAESTSSVTATLLLKNLESGLLAKVSIESSRLSAGGISFDNTISTLDVYPYSLDDPADVIRLICEIFSALFLLSMIGVELYELSSTGWRSYVSFANLLDLVGYGLMCSIAVVWMQYSSLADELVSQEQTQFNLYQNEMATHRVLHVKKEMAKLQKFFETVAQIERKLQLYDGLATVALVTIVLQIIKNLDFHPKMGIISRTIKRAQTDLLGFLTLQGCVTGLYAYQGVLLFGAVSGQFSSFTTATSTLLIVLTGELPEDLPSDATAQLFLWSYLILSFFITLNALLAIIVRAFWAFLCAVWGTDC